MTILSIQRTSGLTKALEADGLSAKKAALVEGELTAARGAAAADITSSLKTPDIATVRDALNQRIAADVSSGKLSTEDAAKISETLDGMQAAQDKAAIPAQATSSAGAKAAPAGNGGKSGGGGGGGSSAKVELSRVVTVTGALKTTVITYTDNTTETKTSVDTGHIASDPAGNDRQADVTPGSLFEAFA